MLSWLCRGKLHPVPLGWRLVLRQVTPRWSLPSTPGTGMDERLRELRLQEERTFLRSVAREEAPECPPDQWHSRAPAIFPEPLASDAALCVPNSPKSHR